MELTGRQRAFLETFLDLYRQARAPLHYTRVAQRLGVSKITAYNMLRRLEERGLVQSEYVLRGQGQGAGRSSILFRPAPQVGIAFTQSVGEEPDQSEWERVRSRLLGALQTAKRTDYGDLLQDILARLPQCRASVPFAAETITALLLSLRQLQEESSLAGLFERLRRLGLTDQVGLSALGGVARSLSFVKGINHNLIEPLLPHISHYQEIVSNLSDENLRRLSGFAGQVMKIVEA